MGFERFVSPATRSLAGVIPPEARNRSKGRSSQCRVAGSAGGVPAIGKRHEAPGNPVVIGRARRRKGCAILMRNGRNCRSHGIQQAVELGFTHHALPSVSAGTVAKPACFQIEANVQIVSIGRLPPAWLINLCAGDENWNSPCRHGRAAHRLSETWQIRARPRQRVHRTVPRSRARAGKRPRELRSTGRPRQACRRGRPPTRHVPSDRRHPARMSRRWCSRRRCRR